MKQAGLDAIAISLDGSNYEAYSKKALSHIIKTNNIAQIANAYARIGNIFGEKLNPSQNTDSVLFYYKKSLELFTQIGHQRGIAVIYNNIAGIYLEQEEADKAIEYYQKAFQIRNKLGDQNGQAIILNNLGNCYKQKKIYSIAIQYLNKSLNISQKISRTDMIIDNYENLSNCYSDKGDYKQALHYKNLYITFKDSLFNDNNSRIITEMQTKYETEKKEKEIELLNKDKLLNETEIRKQTLLRNSFIIGFALLLILAYLLYTRYKIKRKANEELTLKNQLISQQKEEISAQRDEILLKNEVLQQANEEITTQRDEIDLQKKIIEEKNHEVMDSIHYALRIQNAVIPDETILQITFADYFILFKPKDIVSGDFFWFAKRKQWILFAVADCTGHGVPGAFMSMLGISFLNEIVARHEVQTAADALNELRNGIIKALKQNISIGNNNSKQPSIIRDGMDIAFCALNTETLELHFAGANNPLWIIKFEDLKMNQFENEMSLSNFQINQSSNNIFEIKGDKQPIGIHEKMNPFTNNKIQLKKGDILYLMSDGFQDQFGGLSGKKFMTKKLKTLLSDISTKPLKEQYSILEKKLFDWQNINDQKYQQTDDITVMGIKI